MIRTDNLISFAAALVSLALMAAAADAALLNIDINGQGGGDPAGITYSGAAAIGAGGDIWNAYAVTDPTDSGVNPTIGGPFVTSTGAVTAVTFDFTSAVGGDNLPGNTSSDLMNDYGYVRGASAGGNAPTSTSFVIGGLVPGQSYDAYFYASAGSFTGNNSVFTIGSSQTAVSGGFTGTYVQNQNYVLFTGLTPNGLGEISGTLNAGDANSYALFNGVQLEGTFVIAVPEPGTWGLAALGGAMLVTRRRRVAKSR